MTLMTRRVELLHLLRDWTGCVPNLPVLGNRGGHSAAGATTAASVSPRVRLQVVVAGCLCYHVAQQQYWPRGAQPFPPGVGV